MAISNRHIPRKFDILAGPKGNNIVTMCGARTLSRLAGVPGITYQPDVVFKQPVNPYKTDVEQMPGWCLKCCRETMKYLAEVKKQDSGLESLQQGIMSKCWDVLKQHPPV